MKKRSIRTAEEVEALYQRRLAGESLRGIAKGLGCTPENVAQMFKQRGYDFRLTKRCQLAECGVVFKATQDHQIACCRAHLKTINSRKMCRTEVVELPCALPECDQLVWMSKAVGTKPGFGPTGTGRRYCCKDHGDLHNRRMASGFYARLLGLDEVCCEECGERDAVEQHHEVFDPRTGSDLSGPTHWLCPTHHQHIHRGLAAYVDGVYVDMRKTIRKGLRSKDALFEGYLGRLQITGSVVATERRLSVRRRVQAWQKHGPSLEEAK